MRLLAGLVLVFALAAPAPAADTTARSALTDGPVLARFPPERLQRMGGFDLGPDAAVWAQQRMRFSRPPGGLPSGPENVGRPQVVLRRL